MVTQGTNTHAAPKFVLSIFPPSTVVLPSAESATETPCRAAPELPVPNSLLPCWLHVIPERVNIQIAPIVSLSPDPPTIAVLPSAESAIDPPR